MGQNSVFAFPSLTGHPTLILLLRRTHQRQSFPGTLNPDPHPRRRRIPILLSASALTQTIPPAVKAAETSIDGEKVRAHVKFLADDLLEGRGPGLRGSEIAAQYIATQFALYGLKPGGDNGTYLQQINMVGMNAIPEKTTMSLVPKRPEGQIGIMLYSYDLKYGDDYTVSNRTLTPTVDIDAPIVFVGYGVTAPEFNWNDYANIDVKGKVILCIVGDPPSTDPNFFGGDALTYYGRWTYKFEQAARMGAVGALIIHRTDLASYGWDVVKNSNTSEKTYLRDNKDPQLEAASWIQLDVAQQILQVLRNLDADAEIEAAGKRGFKAYSTSRSHHGPRRKRSPPLPIAQRRRHPAPTVAPFDSCSGIATVGLIAPLTRPTRPFSTPRTSTISASSPACPATTSTTAPPTTPPAAACSSNSPASGRNSLNPARSSRTPSSSPPSPPKNKVSSAANTSASTHPSPPARSPSTSTTT